MIVSTLRLPGQSKIDRALFGPRSAGQRRARGQQIAARGTCYPGQTAVSGLTAGRTYRAPFKAQKDGAGLILAFANERLGGETTHAASIFVSASIEIDGTLHQLTYLGATEWEVEPGAIVYTDPLMVTVETGDTAYHRTFVRTAIAAQSVPPAWAGSYTGMWWSEGDQTMAASPATSNTFINHYGPLALLAMSVDVSEPCVAFIGDSIGAGQGDNAADHAQSDNTNVGPGYLKRAAYVAGTPHLQLSVPGAKVADIVEDGFGATRLAMVYGCTHAVISLGSNDLASGDSAATVIANTETLIGWVRDRGAQQVAVNTILPRTTGTFATLGGQTLPGWEANRLTVNAAIRNNTGLIHDVVLDGAAAVESDAEPGKWEPTPLTADGSHPNEAGYEAMAAAISSSFADLVAA